MVKRDPSPKGGNLPRRRFLEIGAGIAATAALLSACSPSGGETGPTPDKAPATSSIDVPAARAAAAQKAELNLKGFEGDPVDVIAKKLGVEDNPELVALIQNTRPDKLAAVKGTPKLTELFTIPKTAIRPGSEAKDICDRLAVLGTAAGNALNDPSVIKASGINNMSSDELIVYTNTNYGELIRTGLTGKPTGTDNLATAPVAWRATIVETTNQSESAIPGGPVPYYYLETCDASKAAVNKTPDGFVVNNVTTGRFDNYSSRWTTGKSNAGSRGPIGNSYVATITVKIVGDHIIVSQGRSETITESHPDGAIIGR